jgi:hypothetical protein
MQTLTMHHGWLRRFKWLLALAALTACGSNGSDEPGPASPTLEQGPCLIDTKDAPDSARELPCLADFQSLASAPLDASLPGARSAKVVLDQADDDALYFQNSTRFQIHYDFVSTHLSGGELPIVTELATFESTEYYTPDRRFVLGAVSYYEEADTWALELSPYDTASAAMIEKLYEAVRKSAYFGPVLSFHPTSEALAATALKLPASVTVVSTQKLYDKIDYQPLTLGTTIGRLHFAHASELENEYLGYEDVVVLDEAPNDISVVAGLITEEFQTPLSHVNVLSQNRHTPNMGLRGAFSNETLLALNGKWVEFSVSPTEWSVHEVSAQEASDYWAGHKPTPVNLPALDLSVTGLWDIEDVTPESADVSLRDAIKKSVTAFGGKAAQYSILAKTDGVPIPKAFAIPVYYYDQFMSENGLYDRIETLLNDEAFKSDPALREAKLTELRDEMLKAPVDEEFQQLLKAKIAKDYPGLTMRFRTSTNSEDLDGFPCAGCYESQSGDPENWDDVLNAVRGAWSSIWLFRTFEERSYYGIDHRSVGMALLVHHNFPDEEANGVAVTNNPFDSAGLEPAFYVNVQWGGKAEVVHPPAGVSSDQFLYFFSNPNQPITYISHSNLVADGETVLDTRQAYELGTALAAIHERFSAAYGPKSGNSGWYAMDVEFKFDDDGSTDGRAKLFVKQARPYPGRGTSQ